MVGKLLKYDLKAYFRVLTPAYLTLWAIALFCRIVQFFEPSLEAMYDAFASYQVYRIIFVSSVVLLVLASIVVIVLTFAQIIILFYRNLFSREGYLSFTLPVSTDQHLTAKLLGAMIVEFAGILAVVIAAVVATFGEVLAEVWKAGTYLLGKLRLEIVEEFGAGHFGGWITEFVLLFIVAAVVQVLFYYFCITLGQRAKKNRVLMAFGVFFLVYVAVQILATLVIILVSVNPEFLDVLFNSIRDGAPGSLHLVMWIGIVIWAGIGVVEYFICRHVINRRLNLE